MKRVLSGMRPTGKLHFGHLHGVLKNWLALQDGYECFFFSADWHALSSDYEETSRLRENTREMFVDWLSVGIDPEKASLFVQSSLLEHAELHLIFSMITPLPWLERNPTYKEQLEQITDKDLRTYGFLGYPVLQAADILIYRAHCVPVGQDQLPHVELTREIARRFNFVFKQELFPIPDPLLTDVPKLLGTDGRKMSKSYNNSIYLSDTPADVEKKVLTMMTDTNRKRKTDPGDPDLCPLFLLHRIYSNDEVRAQVVEDCKGARIGCIECKKRLLGNLMAEVEAYWERRRHYEAHPDEVDAIVEAGTKRARSCAQATMADVRAAIGL